MAEPKILPDLEVDVNENYEKDFVLVLGGSLIMESGDYIIKGVEAFCLLTSLCITYISLK